MAFQEIPKGQAEAAQAIGMKKFQILWRVTLPQVWRIALPGLGNLFWYRSKIPRWFSVVGLEDIMRHAKTAATSTQSPFHFYMAAALLYLSLTVIITGVIMWLEWVNNPAERYAKRLQKSAWQNRGYINELELANYLIVSQNCCKAVLSPLSLWCCRVYWGLCWQCR